MQSRSQPDSEEIARRPELSYSKKDENQEEGTEKEEDSGRDPKSINESYAVGTIIKTPGRLSEEVERVTTDPLQEQSSHQTDRIVSGDRE